jgi:hypothetical protein
LLTESRAAVVAVVVALKQLAVALVVAVVVVQKCDKVGLP